MIALVTIIGLHYHYLPLPLSHPLQHHQARPLKSLLLVVHPISTVTSLFHATQVEVRLLQFALVPEWVVYCTHLTRLAGGA